MKRKITLFSMCSILIFTFIACRDANFNTSYNNYIDLYIVASSFVESTNEVITNLGYIDADKLERELVMLKGFYQQMIYYSNTNEEEVICVSMQKYNEYLELLLGFAQKKNEYTLEEEGDIFSYSLLVYTIRKDLLAGR